MNQLKVGDCVLTPVGTGFVTSVWPDTSEVEVYLDGDVNAVLVDVEKVQSLE